MKKISLFILCLIIAINSYAQKDKDKALEKITSIRKRVLAGENFCTLAKKYSEDGSSARYCGEIGMHEREELVKNYSDAMIALKVGEISDVIETEYGYHIIQLLSIQGNKYETRHILIKRFRCY